ncbi:MAG: methylthioribose-phosphate isomerase [Chloroflexota bacterium]|nr:methylthioribose-phosphate isomerase [Chloroflexota bacterium]
MKTLAIVESGAAAAAPVAGVRWDGRGLVIVDQRRLPAELLEWRLDTVDDVIQAIRTLAVRGAPAIGLAGAYGIVVGLREHRPASVPDAIATVAALEERLRAVRPTAVNLAGSLARVRRAATASGATTVDTLEAIALAEAVAIHDEDRAATGAIGRFGAELLAATPRILTHCNTGRLATGGDGTALSAIYALAAAGGQPQVLATESRPLLQGARLTAWELEAAGIDVRLIVDSAAGAAMAAGLVQALIVGCDRVAANGDTANKIGTYQLAVLARHHGLPFYVAGPLSSFDPQTPNGRAIVVEERDAAEVRGFGGQATAPAGVRAWNPAFDVTPADLVTAFVTEQGVLRPPFGAAIAGAFARGDASRPQESGA